MYETLALGRIPVFINTDCTLPFSNIIEWDKHVVWIEKEDIINIVIQINGKKRGLIKTKPNISEEKLFEIINNDETLIKYIDKNNVKKKIYIQDKLMNIIV